MFIWQREKKTINYSKNGQKQYKIRSNIGIIIENLCKCLQCGASVDTIVFISTQALCWKKRNSMRNELNKHLKFKYYYNTPLLLLQRTTIIYIHPN